MGHLNRITFLFLSLSAPALAAEEPSRRCDKVQAEFREMESLTPKNCPESQEVHARYKNASAEVMQHCRRLEGRVNGGPIKLKLGTEEEMRYEAMETKRKDLEERFTLTQKIGHELLFTPIDTDSPARPPAQVTDACRDELDAYAKIRRIVMMSFGRFFTQIDKDDDSLFFQASERALPKGTRPASVNQTPKP